MSEHPAVARRPGGFDFGTYFGLLRLDVRRVVLAAKATLRRPTWTTAGERLVFVLSGALQVDSMTTMTAGHALGLASSTAAPVLTATERTELLFVREWCRPNDRVSAQLPPTPRTWRELETPDDAHYPGSDELLSIGAPFAPAFGLWRIGVHHERLPLGRRTSEPHTEESEEEFALVLAGTPSVWINGEVTRLAPGNAVGFAASLGVAHTMLNDGPDEVRLLVVGEASRQRGRVHYPLSPMRNTALGARWWNNAPRHLLGPHDGRPQRRSRL